MQRMRRDRLPWHWQGVLPVVAVAVLLPVLVPLLLPPPLAGLCSTLLPLLLLLLPRVPLQHRQGPLQKDRTLPSCLWRLP